jgi:hypothetical protein
MTSPNPQTELPDDAVAKAKAAQLTKAQRASFVAGKWNIYPGSLAFQSLGLIEKLPSYMAQITPLGLAVRRILSGER